MVRFWLLSTLILSFHTALYGQTGQPSLKIYVYNNAGASAQTLARAEGRARDIFLQSGVRTSWYQCPAPAGTAGDCSGLLDADTIVVQIAHSGDIGNEVFGAAFLDADGHGQHADVFFDEAKKLCAHADVSLPDLVGYIIAHEIGHLLLGKDAHSSLGIMTARWQAHELQQAERGRLVFLEQQSKKMRTRLTAIASATTSPAGLGD